MSYSASSRRFALAASASLWFSVGSVPAGAAITYSTSWLGNTDGIPEGHIPQDLSDLAVTPDGKVVGATLWDEGGSNIGVFQNGRLIGRGLESGTGDWGRSSNGIVATDDEYFYFAIAQGGGYGGIPEGQTQQEIKRYRYDGKPAGFPGGTQYDGSCLNVVTTNDCGNKPVVGLVVHANELYAADSYSGTMKVYALPLNGQQTTRSWPIERPGRLDADAEGCLWMLQPRAAGNPARLVRYSSAGVLQPQQIVFADAMIPNDFCVDRVGNRILVTNRGVDQNILIYADIITSPKANGTLGAMGGILSGTPGLYQPLKFNQPSGVGIDAQSNFYVANYGTTLEAYSPAGARLWEVQGLMFVDCVDAKPGDETVVYGKEERYELDFSKREPGAEWTYRGYTLNRFKYPQDPRLHGSAASVLAREIGGQTFLYMTGMYGEAYSVYRFNPATDGEVAIPCALFGPSETTGDWPPNRPVRGEWTWSDANGNGAFDAGEFSQPANPLGDTKSWTWYVDRRGTVWTQNAATGKIRRFPCQGLNASGAPNYGYGNMQETSRPEALTGLNTLMYDPPTDVMYLTGYTAEYPAPPGYAGGVVGHALMRVNDWQAGNRTPAWTVEVPMDIPTDVFAKAITMAGDYVFSVACRGKNPVTVFSKSTGAQVATLTPGPEIGSKQGWVDIPYGINAYQRANGEYLVFVEDDGFLKVVMYRMSDGLPMKVATPTFGLEPGAYDRAQTVAIACATQGATLRYTIDGSIPTAATGSVYTQPVTLHANAILRAIACKDAMSDSDVASGAYAIRTQVAVPTFSPAPNTYSTPLAVALSSATRGAAVRFTTDGTAPTATTGTPYTQPVAISASTTLRAAAFADGMTPSDVVTGPYAISAEEVRLIPVGGDAFLFNDDKAEWQAKSPLPHTYTLLFDPAVELDRLVLWMPTAWGGPVNLTTELRGGLATDSLATLVPSTVYSIAGSTPVAITLPPPRLRVLQIVVSATHNGQGNLSEVEAYGHNVQRRDSPEAATVMILSEQSQASARHSLEP